VDLVLGRQAERELDVPHRVDVIDVAEQAGGRVVHLQARVGHRRAAERRRAAVHVDVGTTDIDGGGLGRRAAGQCGQGGGREKGSHAHVGFSPNRSHWPEASTVWKKPRSSAWQNGGTSEPWYSATALEPAAAFCCWKPPKTRSPAVPAGS